LRPSSLLLPLLNVFEPTAAIEKTMAPTNSSTALFAFLSSSILVDLPLQLELGTSDDIDVSGETFR
jgi:hypothetical protein